SRNRTGVYGFAVRCVTTPPSGLGAVGGRKCAALVAKSSRGSAGGPKNLVRRGAKPLGEGEWLI
ncbi:hypothetical protein, partial [Sphingobium amiense]|uniref:hypothetical protein n=1 Tax=Sphingobium amiense TaxID=135719 RepID=UPI001C3F4B36